VNDESLETRVAELERKVAELYRRIGENEPGFDRDAAAADPRILEALRAGKEIQAIKLYRELTDAGLAEAKRAIEELARFHKPLG
jgi:ribosomal protein L7/L12